MCRNTIQTPIKNFIIKYEHKTRRSICFSYALPGLSVRYK
ncbi:hypothetical protein BRYFOR_08791 [Marvinbryantia formatexigens DSM 14469]|uniref:Uncharacterized protein n=1 Tax=Marvinbryantia formatexigens DSM 14469 TaxID=478749 RepID=C6LJF5_9FIRM|nr:hypothetical protein BRYFOR_08791 [Marvinbryantia formatexigens DSM 14469]